MSLWSNAGMVDALTGQNLTTANIDGLLVQDSFDPSDFEDADVLSDLSLGTHEVSASGYARTDILSRTVTKDEPTDVITYDAENTIYSPGIAAGEKVIGEIHFRNVGTDGTNIPLVMVTFGDFRIETVNTGSEVVGLHTDHGDVTSLFPGGASLSIHGSTGNDGDYTVSSSAFTGGRTEITVNEDITDATADGRAYKTIPTDGNNFQVQYGASGVAQVALQRT